MRLAMGMRQSELARAARIKPSTLSDLEHGGTKRPRGDTLVQIAAALRVDQDWLITGHGLPTRKVQPDIQESALLDVYAHLLPANRAALIAAARAMLDSQPKPTSASPFKRPKPHP